MVSKESALTIGSESTMMSLLTSSGCLSASMRLSRPPREWPMTKLTPEEIAAAHLHLEEFLEKIKAVPEADRRPNTNPRLEGPFGMQFDDDEPPADRSDDGR